MKPNEIRQRDLEKWTRGSSAAQQCASEGERAGSAMTPPQAPDLVHTMAAKSRLADLGEQTSALAHELRQPLFSIAIANENLRLLLERADLGSSQPLITRAVERIAEQVKRAQTIIDHTLAYASGRGMSTVAAADMSLSARNAIGFLRPLFDTANIVVEERLDHTAALIALSQVEIEQVFVNILRNAMESIEARRESGWAGTGCVRVDVTVSGNRVRCTIADNGAGLAYDASRMAFQPFFTTKPRIGTGLGLHICRQVLEKADGSVVLMPEQNEGARIEIELPALGSSGAA